VILVANILKNEKKNFIGLLDPLMDRKDGAFIANLFFFLW
jgi:hypothetical protein